MYSQMSYMTKEVQQNLYLAIVSLFACEDNFDMFKSPKQ